jgi:predicted permease
MSLINRLRSLIRRAELENNLEEELKFHVEMKTRENLAAGMSAREARAAALRQFGNLTRAKEEARTTWSFPRLETLLQDLRYGLRQLRRTPGFTAAAVLTLALGIGATTALFTVVRSVLLKPLPYKDPDRLVRLYECSPDDKFPYNWIAAGVFAQWKKQSRGFSDLALVGPWMQYSLSGAGGQLPERVHAAECSWNLFSTLGVEPALGRQFTAADDQLSANATVVLSWGLWQRRFGGDPSILNQTILLDAKPYVVIGIMPSWFAYPDISTQLWTPVYHEEKSEEIQAIDSHDFTAVGRLSPGVSEREATAELSVITRRLHDEHLDNPFVGKAANSRPLLDGMVGDVRTPLYILLAATGCLLLIACLNVASLLVARGAARRRELAIRTALGGSRWRLLGEHLTESLLLSAGGGGAGILLANALIQWFVAARPDMSRIEAIRMDGWVAAFVLGLVFACAFFASLTSSLSLRGGEILSSLQESSRSQSAGHARVKLRQGLLTLEVGLTVVLLIGAVLLLKGYQRIRSADLGCVTKNVLTMRLSLPEAKYSRGAQRVNFYQALLERVRSLPGVEGAGLVRVVPGQGYGGDSGFAIAEHPPLPLGKGQNAIVRWADPGYFATLGIPLLRGKTFDLNQQLEKAREVIISASFASKYFPGEDPLGKHLIAISRQSFEVVGVVGDTRFQISEPAQPMMYFPVYATLYNGVPPWATLAVRSDHDVSSLALPIQKIVQEFDPELAVGDVLTMNQIIGKSTLDASFDATLLLAFAVFSLVLAAVGLFGVLSYIVAQRTQEIGIRMALGAQKIDVLRLVVGQGMLPAFLGLGVGVAGALGLTRFLTSLLYGVKPADPMTFVLVSAILIGVALLASYIPARGATKVDPIVALRYE